MLQSYTCLEGLLCFPLENHSVPIPQDHPHPVTIGTPTRSPKRLSFSEKVTITQSFLQQIIPVATVKSLNPINILDDDDDDNVSLQLAMGSGKLYCVV